MTTEEGKPNISDLELIQAMREAILSAAGPQLIRLEFHRHGIFTREFITQVLDELENKLDYCGAGLDEMTAMDKLCFQLLRDSSQLDSYLEGWPHPDSPPIKLANSTDEWVAAQQEIAP